MKITKRQLKQIIKEEMKNILQENKMKRTKASLRQIIREMDDMTKKPGYYSSRPLDAYKAFKRAQYDAGWNLDDAEAVGEYVAVVSGDFDDDAKNQIAKLSELLKFDDEQKKKALEVFYQTRRDIEAGHYVG